MRRAVFLGDSVAGAEVQPDEAYPQVLQRRFEEEGRPVEVFNVALWGWSTRQERIAYERIARRYHPDDVVLAVCLNDIPELQNNLTRPPRLLTEMFRRSALVRVAVNAQGREIQSVEQLFEQPESKKVRDGLARFFEEVNALRGAVRGDGATFGMVIFPFRFQVQAKAPRPIVQERIAAFCQAEGLACLDLLPAIRGMGEAAFVDYDHMNPAGAQLVAKAIADSSFAGGAFARGSLPAGADAMADRGAARRRCGAPRRRVGARAAEATEAAAGLAATLRDPEESVRGEAARALGSLGEAGRDQAPALFAALCDDRASVRWAAALSLSQIQLAAAAAVPALVAALRSDDEYVRGFAAWTLGAMGKDAREAVPALVEALQRTRPTSAARPRPGEMGAAAAAAVPALQAGCAAPTATAGGRRPHVGRIGPRLRRDPRADALADRTSTCARARALGRMAPRPAPRRRAPAGVRTRPCGGRPRPPGSVGPRA